MARRANKTKLLATYIVLPPSPSYPIKINAYYFQNAEKDRYPFKYIICVYLLVMM